MGAKLKVLQIFSTIITLLLKIICKTLSNCPPEVSGCKCLKLGFSEFLALLYLLPLRKRCTLTIDFRNIGVKSWVLVLKSFKQTLNWKFCFQKGKCVNMTKNVVSLGLESVYTLNNVEVPTMSSPSVTIYSYDIKAQNIGHIHSSFKQTLNWKFCFQKGKCVFFSRTKRLL